MKIQDLELQLAQEKLGLLVKEQVAEQVPVVAMEHVNEAFNALGEVPRGKLRGLIVMAAYDGQGTDGEAGCGVRLVSMGTPAIMEALIELQVCKINQQLASGPCPGCGKDHSLDQPGGGIEALMNAVLGLPKRGDRH